MHMNVCVSDAAVSMAMAMSQARLFKQLGSCQRHLYRPIK
jgi:hypothetical protein